MRLKFLAQTFKVQTDRSEYVFKSGSLGYVKDFLLQRESEGEKILAVYEKAGPRFIKISE